MRRPIVIAVAATAALATAGLGLATLTTSGVSATTATFSAAKERSETRTCTGDNDTYEITSGRYAGKIDFADPNSDLDGDVQIQVRTVLNKTDGVGYVDGWLRIKDTDRRGLARFVGTLDGSGNVDGFVQGQVSRKHAALLGGMSAKFSASGGFTEGKIGNGSTSLPAVLVGRPCKDTKPAPIAVRLVVKGKVSKLDSDVDHRRPEGRDSASELRHQGREVTIRRRRCRRDRGGDGLRPRRRQDDAPQAEQATLNRSSSTARRERAPSGRPLSFRSASRTAP